VFCTPTGQVFCTPTGQCFVSLFMDFVRSFSCLDFNWILVRETVNVTSPLPCCHGNWKNNTLLHCFLCFVSQTYFDSEKWKSIIPCVYSSSVVVKFTADENLVGMWSGVKKDMLNILFEEVTWTQRMKAWCQYLPSRHVISVPYAIVQIMI